MMSATSCRTGDRRADVIHESIAERDRTSLSPSRPGSTNRDCGPISRFRGLERTWMLLRMQTTIRELAVHRLGRVAPVAILLLVLGRVGFAVAPQDEYRDQIVPILKSYCFKCHGDQRQKGDVRFDTADADLTKPETLELWEMALDVVRDGDMPPRRSEQPTAGEREILVEWMSKSLKAAAAKDPQHVAVLRRLNRVQYTRSLQELLGLEIDFGRKLPADGKSHMGFTNNGEVLRASPLHLEYYQDIARAALDKAIVHGDKPESTHYRVEFGTGTGKDKPGGQTGGYQSVPLNPDDFFVEILDAEGKPKVGTDAAGQAKLDRIKRKITVGLRGSSNDRFETVKEGVMLYGALPHKEVAPGAWQGPSPNMKLEMQRVFPEEGDFVMRVEASRGYLVAGKRRLLVKLDDPKPLSSLRRREKDEPLTETQTLSLQPTAFGPWHVAGPIFTKTGKIARDTEFTPKSKLDFDATLSDGKTTWRPAGEIDGVIQRYKRKIGAVLLAQVIDAPSARTVELSFGSDDAMWVWLNGKQVLAADVRRSIAADQNKIVVELNQGRNELVFKVANFGGGFGSYVRLVHDGARRGVAPYEVIVEENARIALAERGADLANLRFEGVALVPNEVPAESRVKVSVKTPTTGYYQFDLVHPVVPPNAMGSIRLQVNGLRLDMRPELTAEQRKQEHTVTPIGAAYLGDGTHVVTLGGPFFVGFSHLVVTRLADGHPLARRLDAQAKARDAQQVAEMRAFIGTRTDDGMDYSTFDGAKKVETPFGDSDVYEFHGRLEDLPIPAPESGDKEVLSGICVLGIWNDHLVKSRRDVGPPLLIKAVEFEAPYLPVWPPESHRRIFHDSPNRDDEDVYTREILASFLPRAFRRDIDDTEIERYLTYWRTGRSGYESYFDSVREVLVAALCSPCFLFLAEPADRTDSEGRISEEVLASRLSYFLTNSPPDAALRQAVETDTLRETLGRQVTRLLDDDRSDGFIRTFVGEWLRIDRLQGMTINANQFPAFTRFVKRDMEQETYRFFAYVLRNDMSLLTLIDSDFAMLNQNLAEFYGIDGVRGGEFRPVPVTPELERGGLISQGAFLAGHSDGSEPHPIKRAVWIKEKLLGRAPLPPPPNVPDLDPTTPGFEDMTLKERIEQHRDNPACMDCHASFDPYGIALETYNAVGLRQIERKGRPVDASTILPDGTQVDGAAGLKHYLKETVPEQFAASLVKHMFAYALGRDVGITDEDEMAAILVKVKAANYSLRSVVQEIIASPSFRDH